MFMIEIAGVKVIHSIMNDLQNSITAMVGVIINMSVVFVDIIHWRLFTSRR